MPLNKVLVIRTDRIGDVLLTTPVFRALKEAWPGVRVAALVRPATAPLLEQNPDVDEILLEKGQPLSVLTQHVRNGHFDIAVHAFCTFRTLWATWQAGIPVRIGPASRWYTMVLTQRVFQHRSRSLCHEGDYNLQLLEPLGIPFAQRKTRLILTEEERAWGWTCLEALRLSRDRPLIGIHPGSGNSSARWPLASYLKLADRFLAARHQVVVTFGSAEGDLEQIMLDQMHRMPIFLPPGSLTLRQLASILSRMDLVVTNSTGPLHMAVALGVPTVSVYSPLPACHPRRWGPYGEGHATLVAPMTPEGAVQMHQLSVDQAWEACQRQLQHRAEVKNHPEPVEGCNAMHASTGSA